MNRTVTDSARLAALALLSRVLDEHQSLAEAGPENRLENPRDRAFAQHLAYGVLRWLSALEWLSGGLLRKPMRRKDRDIHRLIMIGLFELWHDGGADHAATHETSECARRLNKPWAVPVINAVLRRFRREQQQLLGRLQESDERFAHPGWLLQALKDDWPGRWREIALENQQPGDLWIRLNRNFDATQTLADLAAAGFDTERHAVLASAVKIMPPAAVSALPGFAEGRFSVQDPAAQLAAGMLAVEQHHVVLDACAAPGGKTCHILEQTPDIELTVIDQSRQRLERVEQNLERLGLRRLPNLRLLAADAADTAGWAEGGTFDRVLLDAPCSATGVIRRHPEIKWLRTQNQVQQAAATQSRLLQSLWPLLKPGGILVYATCSVLNLENDAQIQAFLESHPDAIADVPDVAWGAAVGAGRQIFPGSLGMDGFYYARLVRKS